MLCCKANSNVLGGGAKRIINYGLQGEPISGSRHDRAHIEAYEHYLTVGSTAGMNLRLADEYILA